MDFSLQRVNGQRIRYFESRAESSIQLVFVPGIFNAEIWQHQFRYFSGTHTTVSFDLWDTERDYHLIKDALEKLLDREMFTNAVLISAGPGNSLVQEVENHESVAATVLTGPSRRFLKMPRRIYRLSGLLFREPKLTKKFFFSESTDYEVASDFSDTVDLPTYSEYLSFANNHSLRKPIKNSLLIKPEDDRLCSNELVDEAGSESLVAIIRDAGSFCFYEKPQDYNKAIHDFLTSLEPFIRDREISKLKKRNRSLEEFAGKKVIQK